MFSREFRCRCHLAVALVCWAPAGRAAEATAEVEGGKVARITVSEAGAGYKTAPAVIFWGGEELGAAAIAVTDGDAVRSIVVTDPGHDYVSPPLVLIPEWFAPDHLAIADDGQVTLDAVIGGGRESNGRTIRPCPTTGGT